MEMLWLVHKHFKDSDGVDYFRLYSSFAAEKLEQLRTGI